jgi:hypothetical protein
VAIVWFISFSDVFGFACFGLLFLLFTVVEVLQIGRAFHREGTPQQTPTTRNLSRQPDVRTAGQSR